MSTNQLNIGLFGFGTVGKGLYEVLQRTSSLQSTIKKICIKNDNKQRTIPLHNFTTNANDLLNDTSINVIVELIDNADAAFEIVKKALQNKKAVVSANKKMIAEHFEELLQLQADNQTPFLYEAACCASIPIIRNLEEYYDNDLLHSCKGIINGSTNFILSKIFADNLSFNEALLLAQQLGFAESNPSLDISGQDAANKLSILLAHAFGVIAAPFQFIFNGIKNVTLNDTQLAKEKKFRIKLVAAAQKLQNGKLSAYVLPQFISSKNELFNVQDEFNAIITESAFSDKHFFKGKGAGAHPTASAVLSDISALRYQYKYEYKKICNDTNTTLTSNYYLKVFVSANQVEKIKKEEFEWIEEWHNEYEYSWAIGVIDANKMFQNNWWKQDGISLILCTDPIIETIEYRKIRKRSLELAGIV